MTHYLVTWAANVEANSEPEAAVVAMAMMKDQGNWDFHASVEELKEE